jgi:subtilisin
MMERRPAWSSSFALETLSTFRPVLPLDDLTPEWAWGGSTGRGVKVGVIDSGIDADHPGVGRGVQGYLAIRDGSGGLVYDTVPHGDDYGHGTACASIIRTLAPDCDLYSIKVLGADLHGRGAVFVSGLAWAIENGMKVCNLSLGSTKKELYGVLHELTDLAYFRNIMLVTAANNLPVPSFPAMYASVISVATHDSKRQDVFYYNPQPPVEFGAPGIDVHVAWCGGGWTTATGNSFAAAHMTGWVAKVLGKHPDLTAFQMKAVLQALAANVARPAGGGNEGGAA